MLSRSMCRDRDIFSCNFGDLDFIFTYLSVTISDICFAAQFFGCFCIDVFIVVLFLVHEFLFDEFKPLAS